MPILKRTSGYTLVELTLGMALFSFILLATTVAIMALFKTYDKGLAIRSTQRNARIIADSLDRDASQAQVITYDAPTPTSICLITSAIKPSPAFVYFKDGSGVLKRAEMTVDPTLGCPPGASITGGQALSSNDVTIEAFDITPYSSPLYAQPRMANYSISIAANSNLTDLDPTTHLCRNLSGGEFCSATILRGTLLARGEVQQ